MSLSLNRGPGKKIASQRQYRVTVLTLTTHNPVTEEHADLRVQNQTVVIHKSRFQNQTVVILYIKADFRTR